MRNDLNLSLQSVSRRQICQELFLLESTTYDDVQQLTSRESLRDLIVATEAHSGKLYHLGMGKSVTRSNLSKANEQRDYHNFEDYAVFMIEHGKEALGLPEPLRLKVVSTPLTPPP